ncbi:MAG: MaoC family dehydratase [Desulfomonile tiedjei]|nr:MaoC family dehydratase [Desulfomonile tiedjei]
MTTLRERALEDLHVGETFSVTRTLSEQDMIRFAATTRDYNPVHFEDRYARAKGMKSRICHGLLVAGLMTEIGGQLGWLASRMDFRFKRPVYFGDTITCTLTITKLGDAGRVELDAVYTNQHGEVVVKAYLSGIVPGESEKEIIRTMLKEGDPTNPLVC